MNSPENRPTSNLKRRASRREFLEGFLYLLGMGGIISASIAYIDSERKLREADGLYAEVDAVNRSRKTIGEPTERQEAIEKKINDLMSLERKDGEIVLISALAIVPAVTAAAAPFIKELAKDEK